MAYVFERYETLPGAILRIAGEQVVRAREQLTDGSAPAEKRVHDARKRFNETRALLRLVRDPLGAQFDVENAWYRDAGRELAAARDAEAVLEALDALELPAALRTKVRRALRRRRAHPPLEGLIAQTVDQLVVAQARLRLWPALDDSFATIEDGLARTYRLGRQLMKNATTATELHEWRKRAKEHWYHVQLLRNVWPPVMKAYAGGVEELSHALGNHHDLEVLRTSLARPPAELLEAIDARQASLASDAKALGLRIYAETPKAWLARMRNYWSAWR
jgi:CHAD domain-containing protein